LSDDKCSQANPETLDALVAAVENDDVLDKVRAYARKRLRSCHMPAGPDDVESAVLDAIADTASGRRSWNPATVSVVTHLCGIISNHTRVLVQRAVKVSILPLSALESPDGREIGLPVDETRAKEIREIVTRVYDLLMQAATEKGDKNVQDLLAALQLGESVRCDIAEITGMTVDEVTKARRRLASLVDGLPAGLRWDAIESLREVSA